MKPGMIELAGRTLIAGFPAAIPEPRLLEAAQKGALGGIILFKRNLGTHREVAELIAAFTSICPKTAPLFTCVDQEGGRVARLSAPVLTLPPMRVLGRIDDAALTERAGRILGRHLAAFGFNVDFAPVLDVDTNPDNPVIGDRAFGSTPEAVIRHGLAFARGMMASGVLPCAKHFPGHGDTDLDSHLALPRLSHDRARLDAIELAPFLAARDAIPTLMSAHVVFDALEPGVPATLSRRVMTELLRETLGYDGLVISDDLEMKAVSEHFGIVPSAIRALEAGCDALLVCSDVDALLAVRDAIADRASSDVAFRARLEASVERADALRHRFVPAPDPEALSEILNDPEARALEAEIGARATETA